MITITCSTCEAKLAVKDENLLGKILACPKCNSLVYVMPSEGPAPPPKPNPALQKRFPDALTHETASGIIGNLAPESRLSDIIVNVEDNAELTDPEIRTRKVLVGILAGLAVIILLGLGFLMIFRGDSEPVVAPPLIRVDNVPIEHAPIEPIPIEHVPPDLVLVPEEPPEESLHSGEVHLTAENRLNTEEHKAPTGNIFPDNVPSNALGETPLFIDSSIPNIDIEQRLALPIHRLHFSEVRFIGFVRNLSQWTGIPMTLDIDEVKARGLSIDTPVSGQFHETTAGEVLTQTLAELNLQWKALDRQILIFPIETADDTVLTFDVSDIVTGTEDLTSEVLAEMLRQLVFPGSIIEVQFDDRLTVTHSGAASRKSPHRQRDEVQRFFEQLRLIRQLPQRTDWDSESIAPEAFGWDQVMEPMTFNHYRPIPLADALRRLESLTGLAILVDHLSLHRASISFSSVYTTVQCDHGTVNDAVELLLASSDSSSLAYRIIDHQTLEITTLESARQPDKMTMEVHAFQQLEDSVPKDEMIRLLRLSVAPETWMSSESAYGGEVVLDMPSHCMLIRQSQPVHRQIRLYLSETELLAP